MGSVVVQIAKAKGMTVIGSAGGAEKCDWVRSLGADQVVDYKAAAVLKGLAAAAPEGVDVYFDNVGGDHLDAAFALARQNARFAVCGMIENYNDATPPSFRFIMRMIAMRIRMKGFIVFDYFPRMGEFYGDMGPWLASGAVKSRETVADGLEAMPDAFLGLFDPQLGMRQQLHPRPSRRPSPSTARWSCPRRCARQRIFSNPACS